MLGSEENFGPRDRLAILVQGPARDGDRMRVLAIRFAFVFAAGGLRFRVLLDSFGSVFRLLGRLSASKGRTKKQQRDKRHQPPRRSISITNNDGLPLHIHAPSPSCIGAITAWSEASREF